MVLALATRIEEKGLWESLFKAKKSHRDQEVSLHGGLERSLCETVMVKPGLCWRPHDAGMLWAFHQRRLVGLRFKPIESLY